MLVLDTFVKALNDNLLLSCLEYLSNAINDEEQIVIDNQFAMKKLCEILYPNGLYSEQLKLIETAIVVVGNLSMAHVMIVQVKIS
jgi:hypothetical protein